MATAFSVKWNEEFPPINKVKVCDIQKAITKKSVIISGVGYEHTKDVLKWMLDSCEGKGLAELPSRLQKPFTYLFFLRATAHEMGCEYLEKEANTAMNRITEVQIHSEDIRALWNLHPADVEMRKFLADHCAIRFWEKRLKAVGVYWALREEIPELNEAINKFCAAKKAERDEEKKKLWQERVKERELGRAEGRKFAWERRGAHDRRKGSAVVQESVKPEVVTLRMEVVRKGTKKSPTYAKLDLAAVGLSKEQFVGRRKST